MELISWRFPYLLLLVLVPFIGWALSFFYHKNQELNYGQQEFWPWIKLAKTGTNRPNWVLFSAWILLVIALAGPRIEEQLPKIDKRTELDLLVVLDSSKSMSAEDLSPSRFVQAQNFIESLANRLTLDDRLGLIAYSYSAHWASPLSFDKNLLKRNLYLLETDILPYAGSAPEKALDFALEELPKYRQAPSLILLVTDSLGNLNAAKVAQQLDLAESHLMLVSLGKTTPTYLRDSEHPTGFLHWDNQRVDLALNKSAFDKFAQEAGAEHFNLDSSAAQLQAIQDHLKTLAKEREITSYEQHFNDYGIFFLLASFILFLWQFNLNLKIRNKFLGLFLGWIILGFLPLEKTFAQAVEATQAYQDELAAGNKLYQDADYLGALIHFREALLSADNDNLKGDSLFKMGESFIELKHWALAVETLEAIDLYHSDNSAAQELLALARAELEKLQQTKPPLPRESKNPRHDLEDAFHGGQKVNEDAADDPSWGAQEFKEREQEFVMPQELAEQESPGELADLTELSAKHKAQETAINYQAVRETEELIRQLKQLEDAQQELLKHLFEREAGFQAKQEETHQVEGVLPW